MQMIDVMKRLAELDAKSPRVVKENQNVAECGPMGMMDGMSDMTIDKPTVPANFSINATAATGNEVADMMSQILTLAGMKQVGNDDLGAEPQGAVVTAEPVSSVGPMAAEPMPSAADDMRSVLDKLNPEPAGGDEGGEELGPFQGNSGDDEGGEEPGGEEGGEEQSPFAGNDQSDDEGDEEGEDDEEETDEGQYDNSPAEAQPTEPFNANEFAHQENQPGSGNTSSGQERQRNLPTATFENLMKEYKSFIGEAEEDEEEMEEAAEKTPTTWTDSKGNKHPATRVKGDKYTGKDAEKDDKKKEVDESTMDILKLAGLK